jgi:hypothetical protein
MSILKIGCNPALPASAGQIKLESISSKIFEQIFSSFPKDRFFGEQSLLKIENVLSLSLGSIQEDGPTFKEVGLAMGLEEDLEITEDEFKQIQELVSPYKLLFARCPFYQIISLELYSAIKDAIYSLGATSDDQMCIDPLFLIFKDLILSTNSFFIHCDDAGSDRVKIATLIPQFKREIKEKLLSSFERKVETKIEKLKSKQAKEKIKKTLKEHDGPIIARFEKALFLFDKVTSCKEAKKLIYKNAFVFPGVKISKKEASQSQILFSFINMVKNIDVRGGGKIFPKDMLSIYEKLEKMIKSINEIEGEQNRIEIGKELIFILKYIEGKMEEYQMEPSFHSMFYNLETIFQSFHLLCYSSYLPDNYFFEMSLLRGCFMSSLSRMKLNEKIDAIVGDVALDKFSDIVKHNQLRFSLRFKEFEDEIIAFEMKTARSKDLYSMRKQAKDVLNKVEILTTQYLLELAAALEGHQEDIEEELFFEDHLWFIDFLVMIHDLDVFVNGTLPRSCEEIAAPFFEIVFQGQKEDLPAELAERLSDVSIAAPSETKEQSLILKEEEDRSTQKKVAKKVLRVKEKLFSEKTLNEERRVREIKSLTVQDLMDLAGKDIRVLFEKLRKSGFERKRAGKGSHEIWGDKKERGSFSVQGVIPNHKSLSKGLLKSLGEQLKLAEKTSK